MPALGHDLPAGIRQRMKAAKDRATRHDARGWRDELRRWHDRLGKVDGEAPSLGSRLERISAAGGSRDVIRHGAVARLIGRDVTRRTLPRALLPAIVLTVDAPDDVIRAAFEAALRQARAADPFPLQKQGRPSRVSNRPWHEVFGSWRNHEILPLAEFLAWRFGLGSVQANHYPDATFARWRDKPPGTTATARSVLYRAIASLPKLDREVVNSPDNFDDSDRAFLAEVTSDFEAAEAKAREKAPDLDC